MDSIDVRIHRDRNRGPDQTANLVNRAGYSYGFDHRPVRVNRSRIGLQARNGRTHIAGRIGKGNIDRDRARAPVRIAFVYGIKNTVGRIVDLADT